jgi:hypothetical protein
MIDVISSSTSGVASGEWGVGETDLNRPLAKVLMQGFLTTDGHR